MSRVPNEARGANSHNKTYNRKPWMMCLGVYQSKICWEFSELTTWNCQSLT